MSTTPLLLVLSAAVGLGIYNLWGWWNGARRVGVIAAHLLLGAGGAEALVVALHGSGLPEDDPQRHTASSRWACWPSRFSRASARPCCGSPASPISRSPRMWARRW